VILFRGQREDWDLLPKITRVKHRTTVLEDERQMMSAFQREAVTFIDPLPNNPWDWLAIAQHHGLPTRLLDWTRNPLAALWFAVREPAESDVPGVVWVYCPNERDVIGEAATGQDPFRGTRTKVYEPRHLIPRIRAQDGVFTVHKYVARRRRFIAFQKNVDKREQLEKVIVPTARFGDLRFQLDRCGLHAASLFPGLDGLSTRLQWLHTMSSDE